MDFNRHLFTQEKQANLDKNNCCKKLTDECSYYSIWATLQCFPPSEEIGSAPVAVDWLSSRKSFLYIENRQASQWNVVAEIESVNRP